ncbi:hypothetical protein PISMIDRAFT_683641 [Pisolithus microcarpus 441]|uniref:Uncharacterized protein n=1 Tax=Pisolithus microcarpus 441 TaxID=765257 RepID=A0A0C9Y2M8_9AGAM|nr:hypothetical protein PISMIDRAFT_683641 [Pisolithus microcarpus 441]
MTGAFNISNTISVLYLTLNFAWTCISSIDLHSASSYPLPEMFSLRFFLNVC